MNKNEKGIVMEVNKQKAIVLTPDGRFLDYNYQGKAPELGVEVQFITNSFNWRYWSILGVAALLAIIIIPFALQPLFNPVIVAYVTVDINPSIELAITKDEKVAFAQPLNPRGEELLTKINLRNLPLERALELITEGAIREKYIAPDRDNTVVISYSSVDRNALNKDNGKTQPQLRQAQLEEKVKEVVTRNQQEAAVEVLQVSFELRDKALELGISSGKLALMLEAQDVGLELSVDTIKDKGIVYAIKEAGGNPGQIVSYFHTHRDRYIATDIALKDINLKEVKEKIENAELTLDNPELKDIGKSLIEKMPSDTQQKIDGILREREIVNKDLLATLKDRIPEHILDKKEDSKLTDNSSPPIIEEPIDELDEEEKEKKKKTAKEHEAEEDKDIEEEEDPVHNEE